MKNAIAGLVTAISISALAAAHPAHAGSGDVAAGLIGGFAAGAIVGTALAPRPAPVYVAPAPVYVAPAPVYVVEPQCYWTRGRPMWDAIAGFAPACRSATERNARSARAFRAQILRLRQLTESGAVERKRISSAQATEIHSHLAVARCGFAAFVCSKNNS